jgi:GTPase
VRCDDCPLALNILSTLVKMQSITGRSGFVVVLGRPSTGKSSLINALCGEKISIVSPVPQTTRNTIRGIYNDTRGQIVFLDTPGLHDAEKKINLRMREIVLSSLEEAEALLYTVDTTRKPGLEEDFVAEIVRTVTVPRIVVTTKRDDPGSDTERTLAFLRSKELDELPRVAVGWLGTDTPGGSAETGLSLLLDELFPLLPEGDRWYPDDHYTDQEPHFRIAEIVREQAILRSREEVPHALYVEVADLEQREKYLWARVFILVERSSQQGILVGKKGANVTAIRRDAERILGEIFPTPVRITLQVKTRPRWRRNDGLLRDLIR